MTDIQILTIAMAIIFPVAALLYSNSRVTDTKETLRADMTAIKVELKADVLLMRTEINNKLDHLLEIVGKHEERLGK